MLLRSDKSHAFCVGKVPMRLLISLALAALLPTASAQVDQVDARRLGSLEFEPCNLSAPGQPAAVQALCTQLDVPENRAEPEGRMISLAIAWVPATGETSADPVFMLAGGPGQGAKASYPSVAAAFAEVNRSRDIILVDQRGTGDSNPLDCRQTAAQDQFNSGSEMNAAAAREFASACLAELSDRADVRHYTTTDAIAYLETVRIAIGAPSINLYGASYGTRVAQQFAAAYPLSTRAVVIDSVVPNDLVLGAEHARTLRRRCNHNLRAVRPKMPVPRHSQIRWRRWRKCVRRWRFPILRRCGTATQRPDSGMRRCQPWGT
jgi:pimeloyl-ACP methyl ester carboxylesterase